MGEAGRGGRVEASIKLPTKREHGVVVFLEPHDDTNVRNICAHLVSAGWEVAIVDLAAVRRAQREGAAPVATARPRADSLELEPGGPPAALKARHRQSAGDEAAPPGKTSSPSIKPHPSLLHSLPIGQVFATRASSAEKQARLFRPSADGGALLPEGVVRSTDVEAAANDGDFAEFEVDSVKLYRALRVVASLDFVLIFTPYDEANFVLCQAIFDHLPRYKRPHVVMSIVDACWDEALHALSPQPIQMVPSIAVAQFLTSTLAPLGGDGGKGSLFDMTSARELGGSAILGSKSAPTALIAATPGARGAGDIRGSESCCLPLADAEAARTRSCARPAAPAQRGTPPRPLGAAAEPLTAADASNRSKRRGESQRDFSDWLRANDSRRASPRAASPERSPS